MRLTRTIARIAATAGLAVAGGAGMAVTGHAGTAAAATCGLPDAHNVIQCDDGSSEFVDTRGHRVIVDAQGAVVRDDPPGTAWY
ncbi:hypothetical protein FOS14_23465 [Skermania sp. ID1734]|uniref:hypothetical protein n=1 Tax=Skermania sp. ID1734 TaxID=2597516 RepID=UPI00117F473A|nr:hypothetical protein [Skermania sp. ID1734]TSD93260.1 hypothetical protein FOS14_23465 [Skermania sp. ID1734]